MCDNSSETFVFTEMEYSVADSHNGIMDGKINAIGRHGKTDYFD